MRELNKQDMIDLLYGCAVLGTGGGGPLADGLALLEEHFEKGKTLKLITLDELPDDEYVVTPYGCGACIRYFYLTDISLNRQPCPASPMEDPGRCVQNVRKLLSVCRSVFSDPAS